MNKRKARLYFMNRAIEIKNDACSGEKENLLYNLMNYVYFVTSDNNLKEDIRWLCWLMDKNEPHNYQLSLLEETQEEFRDLK